MRAFKNLEEARRFIGGCTRDAARHVEASRSRELLNQDTCYWGTLKGVAKIYVHPGYRLNGQTPAQALREPLGLPESPSPAPVHVVADGEEVTPAP